MTVIRRPYHHPHDFALLSAFLSHARVSVADVHYLHSGDLSWQLFHMLADYQLADLVHIWEASDGTVLGFVMLYPAYGGFELQLHLHYRQQLLNPELLDWVEQRFHTPNVRSTLVHARDTAYITLLTEQGYRVQGTWDYMERALHNLPPTAPLPPGFVIRSVAGDQEAALRAAVLAAAFEAPAQPERYRAFLHAPGYLPDLDIVAVAPTGAFAAFAMSWVERASKVGQFEPVGTDPFYRRRGLGRAVLVEGLRRMQQHGAERAIVIVEAAEEASVKLYTSLGFRKQWSLLWYTKHMAV